MTITPRKKRRKKQYRAVGRHIAMTYRYPTFFFFSFIYLFSFDKDRKISYKNMSTSCKPFTEKTNDIQNEESAKIIPSSAFL
jgi:hypothetical protein